MTWEQITFAVCIVLFLGALVLMCWEAAERLLHRSKRRFIEYNSYERKLIASFAERAAQDIEDATAPCSCKSRECWKCDRRVYSTALAAMVRRNGGAV